MFLDLVELDPGMVQLKWCITQGSLLHSVVEQTLPPMQIPVSFQNPVKFLLVMLVPYLKRIILAELGFELVL
jgi:hypothetical protein